MNVLDEFLTLSKKNYSPPEMVLFKEALNLIEPELKNKKRLSGDSFFEHNLRVAFLLAESKAAPEAVLAGLLHGELSSEMKNKIKIKFGKELGNELLQLITEVSEIKELKSKNKQLDAEALRKILLTTLKDWRVIQVKLANKLDNLKSVGFLPQGERERIAKEVLDVYAPLAYRLGMEKIRVPLEDLAFQILNPQKYNEIVNFLKEGREQREKDALEAIELIRKIAGGKVKIIKIKGRSKHIYSIYKKLVNNQLRLNELYDLLGVRVLVSEIKDCYSLLGLLHENFEPLDGRLKDYIANPKPNGYRSIHTGLRLKNGKILEVQIRTSEMDELAEEGVAAHWRYKKLSSEESFEKRVSWLRNVMDLQKNVHDKDFLEAAKVDVFGDEIYCYTPKGDVKELPKGASILDFAYLVHEEVGNHTVGGKINGRFGSLKEELKLGDVVEIITNKNQRPRRTWLKLVKSASAKQKIRKSLKEHEKLPALYYRTFKPVVNEEEGLLVEAKDFPQAVCVLAKCCWSLPGEAIIGLPTKRRVISVHKEDCRAALKEEERWVKVNWKNSFSQKIRFNVTAEERSGLLADLLHTIAQAGFEVKEAKGKLIDSKQALDSFTIVPRDLEHLKELMRRVKKVKGVKRIYFE